MISTFVFMFSFEMILICFELTTNGFRCRLFSPWTLNAVFHCSKNEVRFARFMDVHFQRHFKSKELHGISFVFLCIFYAHEIPEKT